MLMRLPKILLVLLITGIVWMLVLGWWRANDHQPATGETLFYLIGIPVALFGGYWLLSRFFDYLRTPTSSTSAAATQRATDAASSEESGPVPNEFFHLLAGAVAGNNGQTPDSLLAAAKAGQRASIDCALIDDDGFPIFSCRSEQADSLASEMAEDAIGPLAHSRFSEETWRALSLISLALEELAPQLSSLMNQENSAVKFQLLWLQPEDWPAVQDSAWKDWILTLLPADLQASDVTFARQRVATDTDALAAVDKAMNASAMDQLTIVVAGISHIGEATVRRWQAGGRLFTASRQAGQVPGEAAVAMLLATQDFELANATDSLISVYKTVADSKSPQNKKKEQTLNALITQATQAAMIDTPDIAAIVADTDHRADPLQELLAATNESFEELDPVEDCATIGSACGTTEPFGSLLALLCAANSAESLQQPVLGISTQHHTSRAVTLVKPVNWSNQSPQGDS